MRTGSDTPLHPGQDVVPPDSASRQAQIYGAHHTTPGAPREDEASYAPRPTVVTQSMRFISASRPRRGNTTELGERRDRIESASQREVLYEQLAPLVRRLIRQYGHDADMRQDLSGEIYCRFCALLDAYDPGRGVPLRPYLIRQLTATTYTYARQQWRTQRRELPWEDDSRGTGLGGHHAERSLDPTREWIDALSSEQVEAALPAAMAKLPQRQRQVVIWRYYEERSFEEMAGILAVQPSTARSLLRHGLNRLRALLVPAESAASSSCG